MKNVYYILRDSVSLRALVYFDKENKQWPKPAVDFLKVIADLFNVNGNFILKDFETENELISLLIADKEYGQKQLDIIKKLNQENKTERKENLTAWDKIFLTKNWEDLVILETKRNQEDLKELEGLVHFYAEIDWSESNEMEVYSYVHSNEELASFIEETAEKIGIHMKSIEEPSHE